MHSTRQLCCLLLVLLAAFGSLPAPASAKASCKPGWGDSGGQCKACLAGSYSTVVKGTRVCQPCPVAFYSSTTKATACTPCPPGLWTGFPGAKSRTGCYPCYPLDPIPQVPLPDGKGGLTCQRCPPGTYATKNGAGCLKCSTPGYFIYKHSSCRACPVGTRHNGKQYADDIFDACERCPFNTYQDQRGQASCKPCPAGTYVLTRKRTSVTTCKPYLSGKTLTFTQSITSKIKEDTYRPTRTTFIERKFAPTSVFTATSGKPYSCDLPTVKRLVGINGGKLTIAANEGRRTQCKSITVYVTPRNKYAVAIRFSVPSKPDQWASYAGNIRKSLIHQPSYVDSSNKGVRRYTLVEDIRWTGVTLK